MKKIQILTLLLCFSLASFAQITETTRSMSLGNNNSCSILLKKTDKKEVEKAWGKYIKDFKGKTKFNKKKDETFTDNAEIKEMSSNTVDVYATFVDQGDDTEMFVWFDLGGAFLSSSTHPERYPFAEKIINDFAMTVSTAMIEDELKENEKMLKKMEGDLKDAEKDQKNHEDDISKYEKKIEEAKAGIEKSIEDQKNHAVEIEKQKAKVEEIKKKLKDLK